MVGDLSGNDGDALNERPLFDVTFLDDHNRNVGDLNGPGYTR